MLGEIRGGGPVWDVESGGTVCVLVADCQRPQSRARLKPETMTVTFEEFSPTHDFFDYKGSISARSDMFVGFKDTQPQLSDNCLFLYSSVPTDHINR